MKIIKKIWDGIRILLFIIKIFSIEDLLYNLSNEIFFNNIVEGNENDKNKEEKDAYNKEIYKNSLMLKFIGAVAFICWLKLSKDEMGYVFFAIVLSEVLEKIVEKTK